MKAVRRRARLEHSGGSTPDLLRRSPGVCWGGRGGKIVVARAHRQKTVFLGLVTGISGPENSVEVSSGLALGHSGLLATGNLNS